MITLNDAENSDTFYCKPVQIGAEKLYAIHAWDGTPLTVVANRELAFVTAIYHDLIPMSVH